MIRTWIASLVLIASSMVMAPAQAGVICSFNGIAAASGTDCLGQPWAVTDGAGWSIPNFGTGAQTFAGPQTATDFHFRCTAGCGRIANGPANNTFFLADPFGVAAFWDETLNAEGNTIDFTFRYQPDILNTGSKFFVNIEVPIDVKHFVFTAWWTDDHRSLPEPSSIGLIGLALMGLGLARRVSSKSTLTAVR